MPNITDFLNFELPRTADRPSSRRAPPLRADQAILPRNQWYYQYEKKPQTNGPSEPTSRSSRREFKVSLDDVIGLASLLVMLVVIDFVWFVHRMARTYSTAKTVLYGRRPLFLEGTSSVYTVILQAE